LPVHTEQGDGCFFPHAPSTLQDEAEKGRGRRRERGGKSRRSRRDDDGDGASDPDKAKLLG